MASIKLLLLSLTSARVWAMVRRDFPLLGFVAALILSQGAGMALSSLLAPTLSLPRFLATPSLGAAMSLALISLLAFSVPFGFNTLIIGAITGFCTTVSFMLTPASLSYPIESTFLGRVTDAPRFRQVGAMTMTIEVLHDSRFRFLDQKIPPHTTMHCRAVHLPWRNSDLLFTNSIALFRAVVEPVKPELNPFGYNATQRRNGITARCKVRLVSTPLLHSPPPLEGLRRSFRDRIEALLGPGERAGLFLSLAFGFNDVLTSNTERAFKRTGLAHLLVVSGYQVTLVFQLFAFIFRLALLRWYRVALCYPVVEIASLSAFIASTAFVLFVGVSDASLRAFFAMAITSTAIVIGRRAGFFNAILASLTILSVIFPGVWCEPGVQLTFAALLGLCLGAASPGGRLRRSVMSCVGACLATSVISAIWFHQFSPAGFILNPLLAPLASLVGCNLGFIATALHLVGIDRSAIVISWTADLLEQFRDLIKWLALFEWSGLELTPFGVAVTVSILLGTLTILTLRQYLRYVTRSGALQFERTPGLSVHLNRDVLQATALH